MRQANFCYNKLPKPTEYKLHPQIFNTLNFSLNYNGASRFHLKWMHQIGASSECSAGSLKEIYVFNGIWLEPFQLKYNCIRSKRNIRIPVCYKRKLVFKYLEINKRFVRKPIQDKGFIVEEKRVFWLETKVYTFDTKIKFNIL